MINFSQNLWSSATVLLFCFGLCMCHPTGHHQQQGRAAVCGYESCAAVDPNKLNVHLVPHTHDDVGWLKTVDQYYYGSQNNIQNAGVQYILDTVVESLLQNPDRKFIYVETAFFWKWWLEQDEDTQQSVKDLVNEGRLEFIGGAWSMNDEAASHYYSIIDQFTWGLRKLNDTFGSCGRPHVGWQIDPFGHSREMASLFAQMGYDGVLFARLDYQDRTNRLNTKTAEVVWEGSPNIGEAADLFTSVLYNFYGPPSGFCFDILCNDQPIIDDKNSADYNVDQKVQDFIQFSRSQAAYYTSNNILLTMGGDFNYQDAQTWFKNLDKLIKYVNAADNTVNVIYSTPSCYLKAVNDAGLTYTTKQDDFFPYASDPHAYWTGYFSSRPTSKYFERLGNNFLQVAKQLEAMTNLGQTGASPLDSLKEAMGVMQHHDSITGTEKQHVTNDYARMLASALEEARGVAETAINTLISDGSSEVGVQNCLHLNVSECDISEQNASPFVVTVYNPLSQAINHSVRIPVVGATYKVQGPDGTEQTIQLVPIPDQVAQVPERQSTATHDLVFTAENLPPLGFRSYYVTKVDDSFDDVKPTDDTSIGDTNLQVTVDETTGLVKTVSVNDEEISLEQNFYYYEGYIGDNDIYEHRSSGAYIFRPIESVPKEISTSAKVTVYKGDIVEEIHQEFSPWVSQIVRIYKGGNHVEFEWLVGPIPIDDNTGKEVVSRFSTDFATDGVFYTDANGREVLERKRDFRPTWTLDNAEPAAGNYYPVTAKIAIRDTTKGQEVAVLNDRAQGGSSLNDGEVELMVHRRLLHDDAFGVGESLNETAFDKGLIARGKHYLMAGSINGASPNLAAQERELAQKKLLPPWLFFSEGGSSFDDWSKTYKMEFSGLTSSLPANVQVKTLEPWRDGQLLLRFEHIMEQNEDSELSKPVSLDYSDLFTTFTIESSQETSLAGNQWIGDMNRLVWKTNTTRKERDLQKSADASDPITLQPMEIETYVINVAKR